MNKKIYEDNRLAYIQYLKSDQSLQSVLNQSGFKKYIVSLDMKTTLEVLKNIYSEAEINTVLPEINALVQWRRENETEFNSEEKNQFLIQLQSINKNSFQSIQNFLEHYDVTKNLNIEAQYDAFCEYLGLTPARAQSLKEKHQMLLNDTRLEEEKEKENFFQNLNILRNKKDMSVKTLHTLLHTPNIEKFFDQEQVTLKDLCQYLKIKYTKELLAQEQSLSQKIDSLIGQYCKYNYTLIHARYVCEIMNITQAEFDKWSHDARLPVAETKQFKKWGKELTSHYFRPIDLIVDNDTLTNWRLMDKGKLFISEDEKRNTQWNKILESLKPHNISFDGKWFIIIDMVIDECHIKLRKDLNIELTIDNFKSIKATLSTVREKAAEINSRKMRANILKKLDSLSLSVQEKTMLLKELHIDYESLNMFDIKPTTFNTLLQNVLEPILKKRQATEIIQTLKIDEYEASFTTARSLNRKINIVVGPTNSGKTYEAIEALKKAKSGVYLAPLRLLALEIYEKLIQSGVPCNLLTGEEHIIDPNARHTAATVEMMSSENVVEVAVIDEFQMLYDRQRGWAWTAALVGVAAREVYIVGSAQALPMTQKLFEKMGESVKVIEKKRLSALTVMNELVSVDDLQKGDAIIAFSRKDVLSYSTLLREKGLKVSTIYGALSPEVRRTQAEKFNSGENHILVSTDAIGMGLNLPITRVLFATLNKFDGEIVRQLNQTEIQQIAGRAGRYGVSGEGFVSMLKNEVNTQKNLLVLKNYLSTPTLEEQTPLSVAPNAWHIEQLSAILKERNLKKILIYFSSMSNNSIFKHANLEHMCLLYDALNLTSFPLLTQYKLLTAPVSAHETEVIDFYNDVLNDIKHNREVYLTTPHYVNEDSAGYLEEAEKMTKILSLYMWLSYNYENINTENIEDMRAKLSRYVSMALIKQNMLSFSKMIKPYVREYARYDEDLFNASYNFFN